MYWSRKGGQGKNFSWWGRGALFNLTCAASFSPVSAPQTRVSLTFPDFELSSAQPGSLPLPALDSVLVQSWVHLVSFLSWTIIPGSPLSKPWLHIFCPAFHVLKMGGQIWLLLLHLGLWHWNTLSLAEREVRPKEDTHGMDRRTRGIWLAAEFCWMSSSQLLLVCWWMTKGRCNF